MHLSVKCVLSLCIAINIQVRADDFVYEYFLHKKLSGITLFSCGQTESDFQFVRRMNSLGHSVAVIRPSLELFDVTAKMLKKDNFAIGMFLDTRCQTRAVNENIIAQTSKYQLYESIHVWLILGTNLSKIAQLMNDSAYSLMTDLVVGVENDIGYNLYDFYNPCKIRGGRLNITIFGYWVAEKGLNVTLTQDKFYRRANLHAMKIKVISVRPGVKLEDHLQDYTRKSEDPVSKYGYGILCQIAELFNFTMELQAAHEWIAKVNRTEIGAMTILERGEVDILASPASASLRFAAKPYGRMLLPGYPYRSFFIFRSNIQRFKWTQHLHPFALDSWFAAVLTTILFVVVVTANQVTEYRGRWFEEAGHAVFGTLGVMTQQGLIVVPTRLAGRVASLFLLLYGLLLTNYYGASVVSSRLSEPVDKMNDSLFALAKSQMTVASMKSRTIDDNLASRGLSEWEVRYFNEKIWTKLPNSKYVSSDEGLRKVTHGGYAYHTSPEIAYPYVAAHWDDHAICDMTEVHVITPRILSFWERVDSPFTEIIKIGLIKSADMGLRARTIQLWKPRTPKCSPVARSVQRITFYEIASAVFMFFVGTALALVIYFIECIVYRLYPSERTARTLRRKKRPAWSKKIITNNLMK